MKGILFSAFILIGTIQTFNTQSSQTKLSEVFPDGLYKSTIKGKGSESIGFEFDSDFSKSRIILAYKSNYDYNKTFIQVRWLELPAENEVSYKKVPIADTIFEKNNSYWTLLPAKQCIANYKVGASGEIILENIYLHVSQKDRLKNFDETTSITNDLKEQEIRISNFAQEEKLRQDQEKAQKELERIEEMKNTPKSEFLKENKEVLTLAKESFGQDDYRKNWTLLKAYINEKDNADGEVVRNDYGAILRKSRTAYLLIRDTETGKCYLKRVWVRKDYEGAGNYGTAYMTYGDKQKGMEVYCENY